ncbi:MAG: hypothetical protein HYZ51_01165 [Candidatus Doudnabacteria bacterium]|nr:hypothetical protein [Candidatus Doudnabacteria bacterium]
MRNAVLMLLVIALCGLAACSLGKQEPAKPDIALVKMGTAADYQSVSVPCPGYSIPDIRMSPDGRLLGDCDRDGQVDEICYKPPAGWPSPCGWIFVLRPGVEEVVSLKKTTIEATIYRNGSYYGTAAQQEFRLLAQKAKKKRSATRSSNALKDPHTSQDFPKKEDQRGVRVAFFLFIDNGALKD